MTNIGALDPYNLISLVDEIDRTCLQIYSKDFPLVVAKDALVKIKIQFRDAISSVITEVYSDWSETIANPEVNQWLGPHRTIPSLNEMVNDIPSILGAPVLCNDIEKDKDNLKFWYGKRMVWTFNCWIQMISPLTKLVAIDTTIFREIPGAAIGAEQDSKVPDTSIIDTILSRWEVVRRLTMEYMAAKSELFASIGIDCPVISIDFKVTTQQILADAKKAFLDGEYAAVSLLLQSLRSALLDVTQLRNTPPEFTIDQISTLALVVVSEDCDLSCGFNWEIIGNIVVDLERIQNRCSPPPSIVLFPFFRIVEQCVTNLISQKQSEKIRDAAISSLRKKVRTKNGTQS